MKRILIANRGEIAIRIARAARERELETVAIYAEDDASSLHLTNADQAHPLRGAGPAPYLDISQLIEAATALSCDALHPGIGFLSESPALAEACQDAGVVFVGPSPEVLARCGDKLASKQLARDVGVPTLASIPAARPALELDAFLDGMGPGSKVMLKAAGGGGGRGMRLLEERASLATSIERCRQEAMAAFGDDRVYLEQYLSQARHIEVQLVADGQEVNHLWMRECSLQRRHQKLVEIAPAPWLSKKVAASILDAALAIGRAMPFCGVATVEFLLSTEGPFYFLEINPRLQVEHTVTEAVTGIDLVHAQLDLADGCSLKALGLSSPPPPRGYAAQARVNMERLDEQGSSKPTSGRIKTFHLPSGPGVRVDTMGYVGYEPSPAFDPLLAKVIAHGSSIEQTLTRLYHSLCELHVEGIDTNQRLLQGLFAHPQVKRGDTTTRFVEDNAKDILKADHPQRHPTPQTQATGEAVSEAPTASLPQDALLAPMDGTVVQLPAVGQRLKKGQELVLLSAMKMEHVVPAPGDGSVTRLLANAGDTVRTGQPLLVFRMAQHQEDASAETAALDLDAIRPDLKESLQRHQAGLDNARPKAVQKRHDRGFRTARENIADLCDPESFVEYGPLALAAQRGTSDVEALIKRSPADGIITGVATVNADRFGPQQSRCAVLSYDYTVMAGTQGYQGHRKTDRLLHVAKEAGLPVLFFTEGGGGRPSDTDLIDVMVSGLECASFREFASLSGEVPLIGINNGRCFAGNAALLGCCDVIIATRSSNIGMGGPAMIEGGGLGQFRPEDIGPIEAQIDNGVVDIAVEDEAEAVAVAKQYLGYFQGPMTGCTAPDQRLLRHAIPENRLRIYEIHTVLEALVDEGTLLELRPHYAPGMITGLARIEGRPIGLIANNPAVLAGAIDTPGAYKAARMMRLCQQFGLPLLLLCDTPGIMVGPEAEKTGTVRAAAAMFLEAAKLTIPFGVVVLRKGYGLGAQAMAGGHFKAPRFIVSWPTGEFGPMGLEGAVKLGFRRQLEAIDDPEAREDMFQQMVDMLYERGKALNIASLFEIDDVIDPIETRRWIATLFQG